MINKLTQRHSYDNIENSFKYMIECPTCGTVLNFGKDDVYKSEDELCIHHEYINCPQCNEKIQLIDNDYYGIMKLIDKEALLREIDKLKQNLSASPIVVIEDVISLVESLEVKDVDLENSVKGRIDYPIIGVDFPNIYPNYKELKDYCDKNGIKDEDKVKIIIIKE